MKRPDDEQGTAWPTLVVRGRFLRVPGIDSWARKAVPKREVVEVSALGFTADSAAEWAAVRIREGRLTEQAARDRALLMTSDAQCEQLLTEARALTLRAPLPASLAGGSLAENLYVTGAATVEALCVGDVLAVVASSSNNKRRRGGGPAASALRLQVASPRQPCSKVDRKLGETWDGGGVRAHAARTGGAGWFLRVLSPGELRDDNMDGVCDSPSGYRFPSGADVEAKWRGTKAELAELAALPALAGFEWRDEAQKMLASWEAAEAKRVCAIL